MKHKYFLNLQWGMGDLLIDLIGSVNLYYKLTSDDVVEYVIYSNKNNDKINFINVNNLFDFFYIKRPKFKTEIKFFNGTESAWIRLKEIHHKENKFEWYEYMVTSKYVKLMNYKIPEKKSEKKKVSYCFYKSTPDLEYKSFCEYSYSKLMSIFKKYEEDYDFVELKQHYKDNRAFNEDVILENSYEIMKKNYFDITTSDFLFCSEGFWSHVSRLFSIPTYIYTKDEEFFVFDEVYGESNLFSYYQNIETILKTNSLNSVVEDEEKLFRLYLNSL